MQILREIVKGKARIAVILPHFDGICILRFAEEVAQNRLRADGTARGADERKLQCFQIAAAVQRFRRDMRDRRIHRQRTQIGTVLQGRLRNLRDGPAVVVCGHGDFGQPLVRNADDGIISALVQLV